VHGHVDDLASGHLDVADVLVEKGLKHNNLVARLDEGHKGAEHAWGKSTRLCRNQEGKPTFVGARGDGDLGVGIQLASPRRGIGVGQGLPEPGAAPGGRVLVALDTVKSSLGGIEDEVGRVVAKEALAHVDNGLPGRRRGRLVDDGPAAVSELKILFPSERIE